LDFIKLENFCTSKDTINRKTIEWEKIPVYHISNKGLISKIYKERLQFNNNKKDNPIQKTGKGLE